MSKAVKTLTPERESINLLRHGTKPWSITARNLAQAAKADLQSRQVNGEYRRQRDQFPVGSTARKLIGPMRKFVFVSKHVSGAETAADIIEAALKDIDTGRRAERRDTQLIYQDRELLEEALALVRIDDALNA